MLNGQSQKHKGGILLTAVYTLALTGVILLYLIGDFQTATEFSLRTKNFYQMKIMTELFLSDYQQGLISETSSGKIFYNTGYLNYQFQETQLIITAYAGKDKRTHIEKIHQLETVDSESDTEIESSSEEISKEE